MKQEPPAGQLRLASPATTKFTAGLLKAAATLFPSKLFSTGGDELNANCYAKDAATQKDLGEPVHLRPKTKILSATMIAAQGKTLEQALDTFTQATHSALRESGKRAVVWEGKRYIFPRPCIF
jgi:hexosaminidase